MYSEKKKLKRFKKNNNGMEHNILEQIKKYFKDILREEIEENWEKLGIYDNIGPTVDEFLQENQLK